MLRIGDKIKFCGEVQRYTVQACDKRYIIATKPFNAQKTYLYTFVDLHEGQRGPCNLIFGLERDVDNAKGAAINLRELNKGTLGLSRRSIPLTEIEIASLARLNNGSSTQ